jgi:glucokinase
MSQKTAEPVTLGVDLGGTKVETALVDRKGRILSADREPTHADKQAQEIIDDIASCIDRCLDKSKGEARALGIGVAGQVDSSGVVRTSPNLGWKDFPLKSALEEKIGLPVVAINDVRAALWGEWRFGAGRETNDLIVIFVGTGIGAGIVSGGRMLKGCSNTAGELGHLTLIDEGRKCHCPGRGCLEAYAGGWAIAERAQEAVQADTEAGQALLESAGSREKITASTVAQAYHRGDLLAYRLIKETESYLAQGLASIVNAFNPCLIVLGGGVIEGLPEMIPNVEKAVRRRALKPALTDLKIVKAALGGQAGLIGAASIARETFLENASL